MGLPSSAPRPLGPVNGRAFDHTVVDDLTFMQAWENGLIRYGLSTILRARQVRRANIARTDPPHGSHPRRMV